VGVSAPVVEKPPLNSSASTTLTIVELYIVKSCGTAMAPVAVEECGLTFGLSATVIHQDFACSAETAMPHTVSRAIVPTILPSCRNQAISLKFRVRSIRFGSARSDDE